MKAVRRSRKSIRLAQSLRDVKSSNSYKKGLVVPDAHHPYHNKLSWELVTAVNETWEPDFVVNLGDAFDCYAVSQHRKDPTRRANLAEEIQQAQECLSIFDPVKEKYFIEGNHEWRLPRYLMDFSPDIYEYLINATGDDLFGLKKKGWHVTPYMQTLSLGKLHFTHDLDKAGESALADAISSFMDNVVIGHTHLLRYMVKGTAFGVPHVGASFGWLGDVEKIDYRHRVKASRDYVQGFGICRLDPETGYSWVTPVPIFGNTCNVEGTIFRI